MWNLFDIYIFNPEENTKQLNCSFVFKIGRWLKYREAWMEWCDDNAYKMNKHREVFLS